MCETTFSDPFGIDVEETQSTGTSTLNRGTTTMTNEEETKQEQSENQEAKRQDETGSSPDQQDGVGPSSPANNNNQYAPPAPCCRPSPESAASLAESSATTETIFVNHGLQAWEKQRQQWSQSQSLSQQQHSTENRRPARHAIAVNVDEIIDAIFTTNRKHNKSQIFPVNVPLPQMVDILQDLWEAEGLDA